MLKRLKLKFMVMISVMLVIGFSSFDEARGQGGVCSPTTFTTGFITFNVTQAPGTTFTAGLLGTLESFNGHNLGGLDWMYTSSATSSDSSVSSFESVLNSNITGSQLVSWWSQKGGRDSAIQVTNTAGQVCSFHTGPTFGGLKFECTISNTPCTSNTDCLTGKSCGSNGFCSDCDVNTCDIPSGTCVLSGKTLDGKPCTTDADCAINNCDPSNAFVNLHVQILDDTCTELVPDFCDTFSPHQTHVYDLANVVTVGGQSIPSANFQNSEGIIVLTPVDSCQSKGAIEFNFLQGSLRMLDLAKSIDEYGVNVYTRLAEDVGSIGECNTATPCTSNTDCPSGQTCDTHSGFCSTGQPCTANPDCAAGTTCDDLAFGFNPCNVLNGLLLCEFFTPGAITELKQNFSTLQTGDATAADLVFLSLSDNYGPPYSADPGSATYAGNITGELEEPFLSCGKFSACFKRLGINDAFPVSESFIPPTPTPTPTATPIVCAPSGTGPTCPSGEVCSDGTAGTCSTTTTTKCFVNTDCPSGETCNGATLGTCITPTATPTKTPSGGGGGGGCSIGGPVEIGTAMANVLVPLVPAFAIGFRVLRRRAKKNQK